MLLRAVLLALAVSALCQAAPPRSRPLPSRRPARMPGPRAAGIISHDSPQIGSHGRLSGDWKVAGCFACGAIHLRPVRPSRTSADFLVRAEPSLIPAGAVIQLPGVWLVAGQVGHLTCKPQPTRIYMLEATD